MQLAVRIFFLVLGLAWGGISGGQVATDPPAKPPGSTAANGVAKGSTSAAQRPQHPGYETRAHHDPDGIGKFYMGREIARVMGYQGASWLDRPDRSQEEGEPDKLYAALDVQAGQVVVDMGCGSGYHTIRLARRVGPKGKVLAVDLQPQMLRLLRDRLTREKLENVELIQSTEKDPKLPPASVDLIVMVDVYHEFAFPFEVMEKLVEAVKPGGRIAFVEFRLEDPKVAIKRVHKMSERQVILEMTPFSEIEHEKTIGSLPWQHVILFRKKGG